MDRLKRFWNGEQPYEPIDDNESERESRPSRKPAFSYVEYAIFLLLGISMLWAWNMFLAAGPYFQHRFRKNQWMSDNFQAAELSVSTITNLGSVLILARLQTNASYPKRIMTSLIINMVVFSLLAASTAIEVSAGVYFAFLMVMMFLASLAAGFCQNGIFAYVTGFAQPGYTQGIMTGQAVAGVLPCIAQIVTVLSTAKSAPSPQDGTSPSGTVPTEPAPVPWTAALAYFLTATAISVITLLAFGYLLARTQQPKPLQDHTSQDAADEPPERKSIPLLYLFRKLFWLALGVAVTFGVTMVFPVFTQLIPSVRPIDEQPLLLQRPSFIPLAFLFWNSGDLFGRLLTALPSLSLVRRPRIVFGLAMLRFVFVGMYHLCNIRGQGAIIESDFFYLVIVQLLFGLSNGYLGSTCMIGAGEWVEPEEREAAGGFMGLCLVGGLTVGSLLSFLISGA